MVGLGSPDNVQEQSAQHADEADPLQKAERAGQPAARELIVEGGQQDDADGKDAKRVEVAEERGVAVAVHTLPHNWIARVWPM